MNKYEFQQRIEEGEELMAHGKYMEAVREFDELNLDLIKQPVRLEKIAAAYEKCRRYRDAEELLLMAHEYAPMSRSILFHLCTIAIKESRLGNNDPEERKEDLETAKKYYREFARLTPPDPKRFVLQYRLARAEEKSNEVLIGILEKMRAEIPDDRWMYELARLYAAEERIDLALDVCHDIDVWFNGGIYLQKSKELRAEMLGERLPIELTEEKMPSDTVEDPVEITRAEREFAEKQDNYLDEFKEDQEIPETAETEREDLRKNFEEEISKKDAEEAAAKAPLVEGVTEEMIRDFEASFRAGELSDGEPEETETDEEEVGLDGGYAVPEAREEVSEEPEEEETSEDSEEAEDVNEPEESFEQEENIPPDVDDTFSDSEESSESEESDEYVMVKVTKSPEDAAVEKEEIEIKAPADDYDTPQEDETEDEIEDETEKKLEIPEENPEPEFFAGLPLNPMVNEITWHFMVFGDTNKMTLECARENIREIMNVNEDAPEKILKIHSSKMEGANIVNSIDQFLGSMVIVEEAGSLTDAQLLDFSKVLDKDDRSLLVCFTDSKKRIYEMMERVPSLQKSFTAVFEAKDYGVDDLFRFAKAYCRESEARMTREAEEEVLRYAQRILTEQSGFYKNSIIDLMDDAIMIAERGGILKNGKIDKEGNLIITEKHIKKAEA